MSSTNTTKTQVRVTGWRTATNDVNYEVKYNKDYVSVTVHTQNEQTITTSGGNLGAEILKHGDIDLRPKMPVSATTSNSVTIIASNNDYRIFVYRIVGATISNRVYGHLLYARKSV